MSSLFSLNESPAMLRPVPLECVYPAIIFYNTSYSNSLVSEIADKIEIYHSFQSQTYFHAT